MSDKMYRCKKLKFLNATESHLKIRASEPKIFSKGKRSLSSISEQISYLRRYKCIQMAEKANEDTSINLPQKYLLRQGDNLCGSVANSTRVSATIICKLRRVSRPHLCVFVSDILWNVHLLDIDSREHGDRSRRAFEHAAPWERSYLQMRAIEDAAC